MSIASASPDNCKECNAEIDQFYAPGYCSEECYFSHKGSKALGKLRREHTVCATCGNILKSIEPPSDEWRHERTSLMRQALNNGAEYCNVDNQIALNAIEGTPASTVSCPDPSDENDYGGVVGFQYRKPEADVAIKEREGANKWNPLLNTGTGCTCGQTEPSVVDKDLRRAMLPLSLARYYLAFKKMSDDGKPVDVPDKDTFFSVFKDTRDFEYALGRAVE